MNAQKVIKNIVFLSGSNCIATNILIVQIFRMKLKENIRSRILER